jgi:hypothetical protein
MPRTSLQIRAFAGSAGSAYLCEIRWSSLAGQTTANRVALAEASFGVLGVPQAERC